MGDWTLLLRRLAGAENSLTLTWAELEDLVGKLPTSAGRHRAWWSGDRPHTYAWRSAGFEVSDLRLGTGVTFVRRRSVDHAPSAEVPTPSVTVAVPTDVSMLLVSCVKEKRGEPSAARDLYTSDLFRKERSYAEASGLPWFILSAEHGLVAPDDWLAPYDRYLPDTSASYRRAFGEWVAARLDLLTGPAAGRTIEVHAGQTYVDAIRGPLEQRGAALLTPLEGLTLGQRLAWYRDSGVSTSAPDNPAETFVRELGRHTDAKSVDAFLASDRTQLSQPGLYSWWVDDQGAADLTDGLGLSLAPGLVYAGLAGATRWPSGKRSSNTLWSRISGMHLGRRHEFSTFRRTLGAILAAHRGSTEIDERALTAWMRDHLRVNAIPYDDPDTLGRLERDVLTTLDPPLNLQGMASTPVRRRLRELRRPFARS